MSSRRHRRQLEAAVVEARTPRERALAHYRLAVFHDNNSREADAILQYARALRLGLDRKTKAACLAWLASSYWKTGQPRMALAKIAAAMRCARDPRLQRFLTGLKQRIVRAATLKERAVYKWRWFR